MRHDPTLKTTTAVGAWLVPPLGAIRTLAELEAALPTLGYSERMTARIGAAIRRARKVYGRPLDRIPADLEAFVERWGRGRVGAIPAGFDDDDQFKEWRKLMRMGLGRAAGGRPSPTKLMPTWDALVTFCRDNQSGHARRVPAHIHLSIGALAARASALGIGPADLTDEAIVAIFAGVQGKERRTLRCGLGSLNKLILGQRKLHEIAHLLPAMPLERPAPVKGAAARLRRGQPGSERLWRDVDEFLSWKCKNGKVRGALSKAARPQVAKNTLKTYENAVNFALAQLDRAGALPAKPRLADLVSVKALETIEDAWRDRMEAEEVKKTAVTLGITMERLVHVAKWLKPKKKVAKALKSHIEGVRETTPSSDAMSPARLAWIQAFAGSVRQQRAVHRLPEELRRRAEAILARWDRGETLPPSMRMQALELGTAATIAAILFRGSCVRAANLHGMKFRGEGATLLLDHEAGPRIAVPGSETKTGADVEGDVDDDGLPIIEWYLERIRPRLISEHPYGANRKAADSDYLFCGPRMDAPLDRTTLEARYRTGVAAVGLDMEMHQARHVCAFVILDQDPNAWDDAAEVLAITPGTLRSHYAWMDRRRACRRGRKHLQTARKNAGKHRKGRHERDD